VSGPRRIRLCADDYGISHAVNAAIRDLVLQGRINATSVMVLAPTFDRSEALALAILNAGSRRVEIGLHFTLTAPFRPLSADYAPMQEGAFLPLGRTLQSALLRKLQTDRIAREAQAQFKAFVAAFGRPPDFIDGHQHVHLFPQVRDAVLSLAKAHAPNAWLRQCGTPPGRARLGDRKALLLNALSRGFRKRAARLGLKVNPAFAGTYNFNDRADFAALFPRVLEGLPDGGLVMCHPGKVDAELQRLDPLTTLREAEYRYFAGPDFPSLLAAKGVTLGATSA
jgi:predicted glycoside hydrolase/deacetylase ChbG (UPF0249 family)